MSRTECRVCLCGPDHDHRACFAAETVARALRDAATVIAQAIVGPRPEITVAPALEPAPEPLPEWARKALIHCEDTVQGHKGELHKEYAQETLDLARKAGVWPEEGA